MRRRLADQRGQTSVEWLAIMVGVVALAGALTVALPSAAGSIASGASHMICRVGGGACGGSTTSAPLPTGVTPTAFNAQSPSPTPTPQPTPTPTPTPTGTIPAAGGAVPTPNPQPGPTPEPPGWRWPASAGTHADQLPTDGDRPYSPPKKARGKPFKTRGGYVDEDGNVWEWAKGGGQHGGEHWDVQQPDGSHTNVAPDGTIIGKDNFPNKRRQPQRPPDAEDDGGSNTAKSVAIGAGAVGVGGLIWWGAKVLSPACGPLAPVCAIAF
jgi:hypothetical protein